MELDSKRPVYNTAKTKGQHVEKEPSMKLPFAGLTCRARRVLGVSAVLIWFFGVVAPATSVAQGLSNRELNRAVRKADQAYEAGLIDEARQLYGRIIESAPQSDPRRGDALYGVAMIQLSPASGQRDVEAAKRLLDRLATAYPNHPRRLEIAAARSLLGGLEVVRVELERSKTAFEARIAELEAERRCEEIAPQVVVVESGDVDERLRALDERLTQARADHEACEAELDKKEQALQQLQETLVGGGS